MLSKGVLFFCACMLAGLAARAAELPQVTTIAGSGAAGIADGPAQKATFLFPSGIAAARDGSIYISDRAAQRIRLLTRSGEVRTVAGSGAIVPPGIFVTPGYRDGAASQAQFNGPEGLAVGPDGALYIADSNNGCIRKLLNAQVTTVVGKCGQNPQPYHANPAFVVDGPLESASLVHPSALAFDAAGNLYIADDGGGLRRWANGILTTVHFAEEHSLPQGDAISAIGVAVSGGADPVVLVSTHADVFAYHPASGGDEIMYPDKASDGNPFGHPNQLAALDAQQFLFTDLISANIRYLRLAKLPFNGSVFTRAIAGGRYERGSDNAGFADGTLEGSRFYDPMGIVVVGKTAIIADGGNRRIRQIALPDTRVSEAGFAPTNHVDSKHYEVALIGASWSFWNTVGNDSICAHIEVALNRSQRFHKPVRCHTIRIDAGKVDNFEDYIKKVFPYERMDLVIMDAEAYASDLPAVRTSTAMAAFGHSFRMRLQQLLSVLQPLRTRLALLWIYNVQDTSDSEWIVQGYPFYRAPPTTFFHEAFTVIAATLRGTPVLHYDMYDDIVKYELSVGAAPLYAAIDQHPSPRGNAFFGDHIAQGLLADGLGQN